jgi:hypothetical protein
MRLRKPRADGSNMLAPASPMTCVPARLVYSGPVTILMESPLTRLAKLSGRFSGGFFIRLAKEKSLRKNEKKRL